MAKCVPEGQLSALGLLHYHPQHYIIRQSSHSSLLFSFQAFVSQALELHRAQEPKCQLEVVGASAMKTRVFSPQGDACQVRQIHWPQ